MGPAEGNEESIANELEENLRERSDTGERRECGKKQAHGAQHLGAWRKVYRNHLN